MLPMATKAHHKFSQSSTKCHFWIKTYHNKSFNQSFCFHITVFCNSQTSISESLKTLSSQGCECWVPSSLISMAASVRVNDAHCSHTPPEPTGQRELRLCTESSVTNLNGFPLETLELLRTICLHNVLQPICYAKCPLEWQ